MSFVSGQSNSSSLRQIWATDQRSWASRLYFFPHERTIDQTAGNAGMANLCAHGGRIHEAELEERAQ
ncbi:hypothetical protein ASC55_14420 [Microbacterium sp. Root322]|nr:hypothetical protein ASC55_14420 [Microbacterium sp. Root322]